MNKELKDNILESSKQYVSELVDSAEISTLEKMVVTWHQRRNLIDGASDETQVLKLIQEVGELSESVCRGLPVIDDIGDCLVVLINIAKRNNLTLRECLAHSYKEIMYRRGTLVNGTYIKEGDEYVKPAEDIWIVWSGGEMPVPEGTLIDVRFRDGIVLSKTKAGMWTKGRSRAAREWEHQGNAYDIVSYRILTGEKS